MTRGERVSWLGITVVFVSLALHWLVTESAWMLVPAFIGLLIGFAGVRRTHHEHEKGE